MNREIKFRGKTIGGEWVYGNYAKINKDFSTVKKGYYISNSSGSPFAFLVRPEIVEQFTGLHDKNGAEIYEGDILSKLDTYTPLGNTYIIGVVVFSDCGFAIRLETKMSEMSMAYKNQYEIIGNIHYNKDLLNNQ